MKVHATNIRETWLPCIWRLVWALNGLKMTWYSLCLLLLFLFRTNGKKGHLDENDLRHCYDNFFRKWHSESCLITAMFKLPFHQLRGRLTIDTLEFYILPTWIKMRAKSFIKSFGKRQWNENRWRCVEKDQLRKYPSVHLEVHFF